MEFSALVNRLYLCQMKLIRNNAVLGLCRRGKERASSICTLMRAISGLFSASVFMFGRVDFETLKIFLRALILTMLLWFLGIIHSS